VLTATAKHRLLCSDFTHPSILSSSTPFFPPRCSDASVPSRTIQNDTPVQVLEIEDLSKSKWEQIEALEMERKGELVKGREVVRVVVDTPDGPSSGSTQGTAAAASGNGPGNGTSTSSGPFKLLLQDVKGQRVYAFELKRVDKIEYPPVMCVGCKIVLKRNSKVARGMVFLEPELTVVLGGKIEVLDKAWRERREQTLRELVGEKRGERA